MALLHFLHGEGFRELVICHLNHGLRGVEADGDAEFVEKVAGDCGYVFRGKKVDLTKIMSGGMEAAGREAGMNFLVRWVKRWAVGGCCWGITRMIRRETVFCGIYARWFSRSAGDGRGPGVQEMGGDGCAGGAGGFLGLGRRSYGDGWWGGAWIFVRMRAMR